jgi:hypothetical protein
MEALKERVELVYLLGSLPDRYVIRDVEHEWTHCTYRASAAASCSCCLPDGLPIAFPPDARIDLPALGRGGGLGGY